MDTKINKEFEDCGLNSKLGHQIEEVVPGSIVQQNDSPHFQPRTRRSIGRSRLPLKRTGSGSIKSSSPRQLFSRVSQKGVWVMFVYKPHTGLLSTLLAV